MALKTLADNLCARASAQLEIEILENALRTTVIHALKSCSGALQLGKNAFFAVRSAADQQSHALHPEEEQIVSPRACSRKRTEFVLGRAAVSDALRQLGETSVAVLRGAAGEPMWPVGTIGSIAHCWPWTVVLAVKTGRQFAIGLDLENLEKAKTIDISDLICSGPELEWVRRGFDPKERAAMIFSAKESVYKGFYPFFHRYIDFKEAELSWLPERESFKVVSVGGARNECPFVRGCEVHCRLFRGLFFSCMVHELPGEAA
jgi:4'-phosphopantetheinyl transferase EntD